MKPGRLSVLLGIVVAAALVAALFTHAPKEDSTQTTAQSLPDSTQAVSLEDIFVQQPVSPTSWLDADYKQVLQHGLSVPGCRAKVIAPPQNRDLNWFRNTLQRASDNLSASDNLEFLHAAALMAQNPADRERLLRKAYKLNPSSPLLAWHQIIDCDSGGCDDKRLLDRAAKLDEGNAAIWVERARPYIRDKNWIAAAKELRRAAASTRYDTYFAEHSALIERALAASTELDYSERITMAVSNGAIVSIPSYGEITTACRDEDNDPGIWIPLCDELGALMAERSGTLISHAIGNALRMISAERSGDLQKIARYTNAHDERHQYLREMTMTGAADLMENDSTFLLRYWEQFTAHGEIVAMKYSIGEANRLRADPSYDQCNFVRPKIVEN